jgi:hypothetical protein
MSYQFEATCYPTALDAARAASASQIGKVVQVGSSTYVIDVVGVADSSITYQLNDISTPSTITKIAPFSAQPCGLLDTSDALVLGWGVAIAWLTTYAVMFLRRGLHE